MSNLNSKIDYMPSIKRYIHRDISFSTPNKEDIQYVLSTITSAISTFMKGEIERYTKHYEISMSYEDIEKQCDLIDKELKDSISEQDIEFLIKNNRMLYISLDGNFAFRFIIDSEGYICIHYIDITDTDITTDDLYRYKDEIMRRG